MSTFLSRGLYCALAVGGLSLLGVGAANAAETSGDDSAGSGNQLGSSLSAPLDITGNAISILGDSSSDGSGSAGSTGADDASAEPVSPVTSGNESIASGNQAALPVNIPVTLGGNAISVLGDSTTSGASTDGAPAAGTDGTETETTGETTGDESIVGGNQVASDVTAPVTANGNAISVLGDSTTSGASTDGTNTNGTADDNTAGSSGETTGNESILGGNQVTPDLTAPITANGNAISILGDSTATDANTDGTVGNDGSATDGNTDGVADGTGSGTGTDGTDVGSDTETGIDIEAGIGTETGLDTEEGTSLLPSDSGSGTDAGTEGAVAVGVDSSTTGSIAGGSTEGESTSSTESGGSFVAAVNASTGITAAGRSELAQTGGLGETALILGISASLLVSGWMAFTSRHARN